MCSSAFNTEDEVYHLVDRVEPPEWWRASADRCGAGKFFVSAEGGRVTDRARERSRDSEGISSGLRLAFASLEVYPIIPESV